MHYFRLNSDFLKKYNAKYLEDEHLFLKKKI